MNSAAFASSIETMVEQEVTRRIGTTQQELVQTKRNLTNANKRNQELTVELDRVKDIASRVEYINQLRELVNVDNISEFFKMLGFKSKDLKGNAGDTFSRSRKWFEIYCNFYDHKDEVLNLFNFFDIKYESWIRGFKMPYEYSLEECIMVIKNWNKMSFSNRDNIEKFFESAVENKGNPKNMSSGSGWRSCIAPELFFKNPHIMKKPCFDEIIKMLASKASDRELFYNLHNYHDLTDDQAAQMMEVMGELKHIGQAQKAFIKKFAKQALVIKPLTASQFEHVMSEETNQNENWKHFTNFPFSSQMKYFEKQYKREDKLRILAQMDMDQEQKLQLVIKHNLL